jgi:hypothetical protein
MRELDYTKTLGPQMEKNVESESKFRHWLFDEVEKHGFKDFQDVRDAGAEMSDCSQQTVDRYLKKVTSSAGMYQIIGKRVMFKPEFMYDLRVKEGVKEQIKPTNGQENTPDDTIGMKIFTKTTENTT